MNEHNNRKIAIQHLERAKKSLKSSQHLFENGLFEDAISRAYYAAYHAASAILYDLGFSPTTHEGLMNLFFTEVIKPGILNEQLIRKIVKLAETRNTADYGALPVFDAEETKEIIEDAKEVLHEIQNYFQQD